MSRRRRRERRDRKGGTTTANAPASRFFSDVCKAVGAPEPRSAPPSACALCWSPRVAFGGLWFPTEAVQAKLLVPTGKQRTIGYCLCERCARDPRAGQRVEDAILSDFAKLAASQTCN
jgi:hypothetical protein